MIEERIIKRKLKAIYADLRLLEFACEKIAVSTDLEDDDIWYKWGELKETCKHAADTLSAEIGEGK